MTGGELLEGMKFGLLGLGVFSSMLTKYKERIRLEEERRKKAEEEARRAQELAAKRAANPGLPPPPGVARKKGGLPPPPGIKKGGAAQPKMKSKTKKMHWSRLSNIDDTIWNDITFGSQDMSKYFSDLETEFSLKQPKKEAAGKPKNVKVDLIRNSKRTQAMNMMLGKLLMGLPKGADKKLAIAEKVEKVIFLDVSAFTEDALGQLSKNVPTGEEKSRVEQYLGNDGDRSMVGAGALKGAAVLWCGTCSRLYTDSCILIHLAPLSLDDNDNKQTGLPEAFVECASAVEGFQKKVKVMLYQKTYDDARDTILERCQKVSALSNEIKNSNKMRRILALVLQTGNQLNVASGKVARGIKLNSLMKTTQTRTNNGQTVLEYIITRTKEREPELLELEEDFPILLKSSRTSWEQLMSDYGKQNLGMQQAHNLIGELEQSGAGVPDSLASFIAQAGPSHEGTKQVGGWGVCSDRGLCCIIHLTQYYHCTVPPSHTQIFEQAKADFASTCKYLGEKGPPKTKLEDMCTTLTSFINAFKSSAKKIIEKEERMAKSKQREEERKLMKLKQQQAKRRQREDELDYSQDVVEEEEED